MLLRVIVGKRLQPAEPFNAVLARPGFEFGKAMPKIVISGVSTRSPPTNAGGELLSKLISEEKSISELAPFSPKNSQMTLSGDVALWP